MMKLNKLSHANFQIWYQDLGTIKIFGEFSFQREERQVGVRFNLEVIG